MNKNCSKCGFEVPQGKKFCGKCGTKVAIARNCAECGTNLPEDDMFCSECGTKYEDTAVSVKPSKARKSAKTANAAVCYNSDRGQMAVIDETLYFIERHSVGNQIYSAPLSGKGKAQMLMGSISTENCGFLCAWNGKLYFDDWYGLMVFDPSTNNMERFSIIAHDETEASSLWFSGMSDGKAYGRTHDKGIFNQFVCVDLLTGEVTKLTMPTVTSKNWMQVDYFDCMKANTQNDKPIVGWNRPIIRSGYAYTSNEDAAEMTLRHPLDNPAAYELLPYGVFFENPSPRISLFATNSNALVSILKPPHQDNCYLCALDLDTLKPIKGYEWRNNELGCGTFTSWMQYGDLLAYASGDTINDNKHFSISEHKILDTHTIPEYSNLTDAIKIKDTWYALDYRKLYRIPHNKILEHKRIELFELKLL